MSDQNSQELLERFRAGEAAAASEIFDRYVHRLLRLVKARISPPLGRRIDPDDVLQSAYRSFFLHARDGEFKLQNAGDLWRLLAAIALHKLQHQVERHTAGRRNIGNEAGQLPSGYLHSIVAREPSPDEVAALIDEWERALRTATP